MRCKKMQIILLTFFTVLLLVCSGCVDIDNPNVKVIDMRTLVKFVYLGDVADSISIIIDGSLVAKLEKGKESEFINVQAGSRKIVLSNLAVSDTFYQSFIPDQKITFYCIYNSGSSEIINMSLFAHPTYAGVIQYVPGSVLVRFANFTNGTVSYTVIADTVSGAERTYDDLAFGDISNNGKYDTLKIKSITDKIIYPRFVVLGTSNDTIVGVTTVSDVAGRYTIALFGNGEYKVVKED